MIDSLEDHAIMVKVKSGDVEKLSLLYHRYSRRLFGFFFRLTNDAATSEDLVQNVFVRMLKYRKSYSETGSFEAWAFHIARNVHKDHFRKNKRYQWQESMTDWEAHLKDTDTREYKMQKSDELNNLERALQALPPEKRELIELTRIQKLKYDQVATLLGISESALKVRVHRTLKELRELYTKVDGNLKDRIN